MLLLKLNKQINMYKFNIYQLKMLDKEQPIQNWCPFNWMLK